MKKLGVKKNLKMLKHETFYKSKLKFRDVKSKYLSLNQSKSYYNKVQNNKSITNFQISPKELK